MEALSDELIVTRDAYGDLRIWDVSVLLPPKCPPIIIKLQDPYYYSIFKVLSPDTIAFTTLTNDIGIWNSGIFMKGHTLRHLIPIKNLLISVSDDGTTRIWNINDQMCEHIIDDYSLCISILSDNKIITKNIDNVFGIYVLVFVKLFSQIIIGVDI